MFAYDPSVPTVFMATPSKCPPAPSDEPPIVFSVEKKTKYFLQKQSDFTVVKGLLVVYKGR